MNSKFWGITDIMKKIFFLTVIFASVLAHYLNGADKITPGSNPPPQPRPKIILTGGNNGNNK